MAFGNAANIVQSSHNDWLAQLGEATREVSLKTLNSSITRLCPTSVDGNSRTYFRYSRSV
jgi:hypothetical protein